jgi:uncharacterized OB-fold protein
MHNNTPQDWNNYYYKCSECGSTYHASEYYCDNCYETENETENETDQPDR